MEHHRPIREQLGNLSRVDGAVFLVWRITYGRLWSNEARLYHELLRIVGYWLAYGRFYERFLGLVCLHLGGIYVKAQGWCL